MSVKGISWTSLHWWPDVRVNRHESRYPTQIDVLQTSPHLPAERLESFIRAFYSAVGNKKLTLKMFLGVTVSDVNSRLVIIRVAKKFWSKTGHLKNCVKIHIT